MDKYKCVECGENEVDDDDEDGMCEACYECYYGEIDEDEDNA